MKVFDILFPKFVMCIGNLFKKCNVFPFKNDLKQNQNRLQMIQFISYLKLYNYLENKKNLN